MFSEKVKHFQVIMDNLLYIMQIRMITLLVGYISLSTYVITWLGNTMTFMAIWVLIRHLKQSDKSTIGPDTIKNCKNISLCMCLVKRDD